MVQRRPPALTERVRPLTYAALDKGTTLAELTGRADLAAACRCTRQEHRFRADDSP